MTFYDGTELDLLITTGRPGCVIGENRLQVLLVSTVWVSAGDAQAVVPYLFND